MELLPLLHVFIKVSILVLEPPLRLKVKHCWCETKHFNTNINYVQFQNIFIG